MNLEPAPLPFAPLPVTQEQRALTARYLLPIQDEIIDLLLDLRRHHDPALARTLKQHADKFYPLGFCMEISDVVRDALLRRIRNPRRRAERALRDFIAAGGIFRPVWGALRERYFQNATQIGSLYVDVSNDTVSFMKPKVEILPFEKSGMVPLRDLAHFRHVAKLYWNRSFYPNHILPSLAPLFPMISLDPKGTASFESGTDYMIALAMRDRFQDAEAWLSTAPPPPPVLTQALSEVLPPELLAQPGEDGRMAAVEACRAARADNRDKDVAWRDHLVTQYRRFSNGGTRPQAA